MQPDPTTGRPNRLRNLLLGAIALLIIAQVVALSPTPLEQSTPASTIEPETLIPKEQVTLATGVPRGRIPEYSVDGFNYVSTAHGKKQWKLVAQRAYLYNAEKIVHTRQVTAYLYDASGNTTVVTGSEAKYVTNQRDLEIFGNVVAKTPDGFETRSEFMRYRPEKRRLEIPIEYAVAGASHPTDAGASPVPGPVPSPALSTVSSPPDTGQQAISFTSMGLDFDMANSIIVLPKAVRFTMQKAPRSINTEPSVGDEPAPTASPSAAGVPDQTVLLSDHCRILRGRRTAKFTMYASRPAKSRFVRITQPNLKARARTADLDYGDYSQGLQYLVLNDDVLIEETGGAAAGRYGTGGRAEFDSRKNIFVLKEFPQVYQEGDTVVGDLITVHRDTDIVEVEHSNAYSSGQSSPNGL